jgi:membrane protease YdiL (CAAX protease family)
MATPKKMAHLLNSFSLILGATLLILLWVAFLTKILPFLATFTPFGAVYTPLGKFIFICILGPIWEELVFRLAPLELSYKLSLSLKQDFTIPTIILSSFWFGWMHEQGVISLLLQGLGGVVLSIVYIQSGRKPSHPILVHMLWNFILIYVIPVLQK